MSSLWQVINDDSNTDIYASDLYDNKNVPTESIFNY